MAAGTVVALLLAMAMPIAQQSAGAAGAAPTVTSVSPSSGYSLVDGAPEPQPTVTITGTNFGGTTSVSFGTFTPYFMVVSSTEIVTYSSGITKVGTVDVTVTTPGGTSAISPSDQFTVVAPPVPTTPPVVTSISPSTVPAGGGEPIVVHGSNFLYVTSVQVGSTSVVGFAVGSQTDLEVTLPAEPIGTVIDLTVTTPGGTSAISPADRITYIVPPPAPPSGGYWEVASDGGVFSFGNALFYGSMGGTHLNAPVVGIAPTPDGGGGYWLVASDGGVFTFGDAAFFGSTGGLHLNRPVVGMTPTPDGDGYWLVASDGGVFNFGDAKFFGSTGAMHLPSPIVAIAPTFDGAGYWLVAADGTVYSFGDGRNIATATGPLSSPVVGIASNPKDEGYWLVTANGAVLSFGDAPNEGSAAGIPLNKPMVGLATRYDENTSAFSYWEAASDGGIFTYGNTPFYGSTGGMRLNAPIVGIGATFQPLEPFAP
jgi:IPT/TIG domain